MGYLYRLMFGNGKSYIGITKQRDPSMRFRDHERCAGDERRKSALYHAWRKHGAPSLQVLAQVENDDLLATEARAVSAYKTQIPSGYNTTPGGDTNPMDFASLRGKISRAMKGRATALGQKRTDETKARLSAAMKGKKASQETREKMSMARRGVKRRPHSQEARENMSAAAKIRAPRTGWKHSEESRLKTSQSVRESWVLRRQREGN